MAAAKIRVSLFVEANPVQLAVAKALGAHVVELHTGAYCEAHAAGDFALRDKILQRLKAGAKEAARLGLEVHAGHGLSFETVGAVAAIPELVELNIGHFLVGEAIFVGLEHSIRRMRVLMDEARGRWRGRVATVTARSRRAHVHDHRHRQRLDRYPADRAIA